MLSTDQIIDRPLGGSSAPQVPHWLGNIIYGILFVLLKVFFRYRVDNLDALRAFADNDTGVVVVSNHTSYLDVAFLWCVARPRQWIRFMARDSLFSNAGGLAGQIIGRVGAFPVKRDTADLGAVKRAAKMLKRGEVVGIFPEGTRRNKGSQVPTLHGGAAMIAKMGHAPLLPATVRNAEKIKEKGHFFRFPQVSIAFGTPIELSSFDFLPKEQRHDGASWYAMRECFALSRECAPEEVDMVELFPDAYDFTTNFADHQIGHTFAGESKEDLLSTSKELADEHSDSTAEED